MLEVSKEVLIFDYGMGNIFSLSKALEHVGAKAIVSSDISLIKDFDAMVLPGVGAFGQAMDNLRELNAVEPILEFLKTDKKFLGICLGFQLLFEGSNEFGESTGLSFFQGRIKHFSHGFENSTFKIPHIGWEKVIPRGQVGVLNTINEDKDSFYFVHSFYAEPTDTNIISSVSKYNDVEFCSSVEQGNVFACQFHPEKSGPSGIKLLESWLNR